MTNVSGLLDEMAEQAMARYPELNAKWAESLSKVAGPGLARGLLRYQADYIFDLVLRCLEDESKLAKKPISLIASTLQINLTRMWVLSMYELLRIAHAARDEHAGRIREIYKLFRLVRVQLAKLEIAEDHALPHPIYLKSIGPGQDFAEYYYSKEKRTEYSPVTYRLHEDHSIGWIVIEARVGVGRMVGRRELADLLLSFEG